MSKTSIVIEGKELRYEIKELDIFEIDYYFDNPRINYVISKYPKEEVTPDLIEKALFEKDSTRELLHDIETNGGLIEPIIVLNSQVIEGNTRLCVYPSVSE